MAIENDVGTGMLFKERLETFLHLEPPAGERRVPAWGLEMAPRLYIDTYDAQRSVQLHKIWY